MEIKRESKETITWDIAMHDSEAIVKNMNLVSLKINPRSGVKTTPEESINGIIVNITSEEQLIEVHKAMTNLIAHLDSQRNFNKTKEE